MGESFIRYSDLTEKDLAVLPSAFVEIKEIIGGEAALQLCLHFGGVGVYFPKMDGLIRCIRDQKIRQEFDGSNHRDLALRYKLSENMIRIILREGKDPRQEELF